MYLKRLLAAIAMMVLTLLYVLYYFFFIQEKEINEIKKQMQNHSNTTPSMSLLQKRDGVVKKFYSNPQQDLSFDVLQAKTSDLVIERTNSSVVIKEILKDFILEKNDKTSVEVVSGEIALLDYKNKTVSIPSALFSRFNTINHQKFQTLQGEGFNLCYNIDRKLLEISSLSAYTGSSDEPSP